MDESWSIFWRDEIQDRWPAWKPTETEIADWTASLSKLNQEWLRAALRAVKQQFSSTTPQLKWVMGAFAEIRRNQSAEINKDGGIQKAAEDMALCRLADEQANLIKWLSCPGAYGMTAQEMETLAQEVGGKSCQRSSNPADWDNVSRRAVHGAAIRVSVSRGIGTA
jgi:hypothetical protein